MYIVSWRHELRNALMKVPVWIWKLMASLQVLTSVNEVKKRTRKGWRSLGEGGKCRELLLLVCLQPVIEDGVPMTKARQKLVGHLAVQVP